MSVACGWRMTFWTIERIKIEVGRPLELWLHYIRCVWGMERALTQTDLGLPSPCHGMRSASVPVEGGSVACTELKALLLSLCHLIPIQPPGQLTLLLSLFYRRGNWTTKRLGILPCVTLIASEEAERRTQSVWPQNYAFKHDIMLSWGVLNIPQI